MVLLPYDKNNKVGKIVWNINYISEIKVDKMKMK